MAVILGRKVAMTQAFNENGGLQPITIIQAGPCKVIETKTDEKNGYSSAVVGFDQIEGSKLKNKSLLGKFKKLGVPVFKVIREFRNFTAEQGSDLTVEQFQKGDKLVVSGRSKGKGFQNAIKRYNFSRGRETHGGNFNRAIGGTGMCEFPGRVFKGKKMPGHMGDRNLTQKSVTVVDVIPEENLLLVRGPVMGGKNGLLTIRKAAA